MKEMLKLAGGEGEPLQQGLPEGSRTKLMGWEGKSKGRARTGNAGEALKSNGIIGFPSNRIKQSTSVHPSVHPSVLDRVSEGLGWPRTY